MLDGLRDWLWERRLDIARRSESDCEVRCLPNPCSRVCRHDLSLQISSTGGAWLPELATKTC